jgi:hypothetical protein
VSLDDAALAANWRTVLAVDAGLGLAVVAAGAAVTVTVHAVLGVLAGVAGAVYLGLVARRCARWRRLRAEAGL